MAIMGHFLPFYTPFPLKNPKNKNFEKKEKIAGDIIIFSKEVYSLFW